MKTLPKASHLIETAFERLARRPGFVERPDQKQLALLLADCIEGPSSAAFEAPTGLGKSLACLVPAIAHALIDGKRTIVATYTNVLAEQYWRDDLPLALNLFDGDPPKTEFLIGRQRYACLAAMEEQKGEVQARFRREATLGIESELRALAGVQARDAAKLWPAMAAPAVCPARLCPHFNECFYYRARRSAERAAIVVTNHSVVMQDALLAQASGGELSLLGEYDYLILDEAHDFPQAALNALEFELSEAKLGQVAAIAAKMEHALLPIAAQSGAGEEWVQTCVAFLEALKRAQRDVAAFGATLGQPGILAVAPAEVEAHEQVKRFAAPQAKGGAEHLAAGVADETAAFVRKAQAAIERSRRSGEVDEGKADEAAETVRNYSMYLREYADGCRSLTEPNPVSVSYVGLRESGAILRHDVVDLAEPLRELLWSRVPTACLSATLAVDGAFDFFKRQTGMAPEFEEVLPSPFDFAAQAALYLPPPGRIPDPTEARKSGSEEAYFDAVARELEQILLAMGGRTLALFHSRREMEAVRERMQLPEELPIVMQRWTGAAHAGERFKKHVAASLFALRSFWTGFDAPGETLSCVALVRVPFEVPVDPPQVARMAWLQTQGVNPFAGHSLPMAKMMMRQGAGRLIRRAGDRGIVAALDARLHTKRYGEEILANLPLEMRRFDDVLEAAAWVGVDRG